MYFFQNYVFSEILKFSKDKKYQDAVILCKNGTFHSNSFLLASIFPIFKTVMNSTISIQTDETQVISMPSMNKSDLEIFFQCLHQEFEKFSPSQDIQELLKPMMTFKDELPEPWNTDMIKNYVDDFTINKGVEIFEQTNDYKSNDSISGRGDNDDFTNYDDEIEKKNEKSRKKIKIKGKTQMISIRQYRSGQYRSHLGRKWLDETKEAEILEQGIGWSKVKQGNRVFRRIDDDRFERDEEDETNRRLKGQTLRLRCKICDYKFHNYVTIGTHFTGTFTCLHPGCDFVSSGGKCAIFQHLRREHNVQDFNPRGECIKLIGLIHQCSICNFQHRSKDNYKRHMDKHEGKKVQCLACGKLVTERGLPMHQRRTCSANKEKCGRCKKYYPINNKNDHICIIKRKKIHQCLQCDYKTKSTTNFRGHMEVHHSEEREKVPCHYCGKLFVQGSLKSHLKSCFIPKGQTRCDKCKKCFQENEEHSCEKFICKICGHFTFSIKGMKEHHKSYHEIVKKIPCTLCGKEYREKDMKRHMLTHQDKQECPQCGVKVRQLNSHIKTVHTPDEEKKYQCQDCGKGFMEQRKLDIHKMNMHLKLKPHRCRYGCDIGYNDTSNRNAHEKKTHGKLFTTVREEKMKTKLELKVL